MNHIVSILFFPLATSIQKDDVLMSLPSVSVFTGYYRYIRLGTDGLANLHIASTWFVLDKNIVFLVNVLGQITSVTVNPFT